MSYNGSVFSSAGGLFAAMLHIYNTGGVPETVPVPVYLRCVAAICASLGAILVGGRLMPVTGKRPHSTMCVYIRGYTCT